MASVLLPTHYCTVEVDETTKLKFIPLSEFSLPEPDSEDIGFSSILTLTSNSFQQEHSCFAEM
jgi:hypothetical protein